MSQQELIPPRLGLPKKCEVFLFFNINDGTVTNFRAQLGKLAPLITTVARVQHDQAKIAEEKERAKAENTKAHILGMAGLNISFSHKGLQQVRRFFWGLNALESC